MAKKNNMIGVTSQGRMGNQMFQYAFGYATSKKLGTNFFMLGYSSLHYFKLYDSLIKYNRIYILLYKLRNILEKNPIKKIYEWPNTTDTNNYLLSSTKNNIIYSGYFQSEEYFKQYRTDIEKLFEIKTQYRTTLIDKKYLFQKKYIAIHIRRTDYKQFNDINLTTKDIRLPIQYYKNCLKKITNLDSYNVIFVSDDIDFVKNEFGVKENYFFEKNDEITDFQILQHAEILIIANSTFSWWAAWLNQKKNRTIYAPNYFLGFSIQKFYPAGIKVTNWNWIDVN